MRILGKDAVYHKVVFEVRYEYGLVWGGTLAHVARLRRRQVAGVERELVPFRRAVSRVERALRRLRRRVDVVGGAEGVKLVDVHRAVLRDPELAADVDRGIHRRLAAETAFDDAMRRVRRRLAGLASPTACDRLGDLAGVHARV